MRLKVARAVKLPAMVFAGFQKVPAGPPVTRNPFPIVTILTSEMSSGSDALSLKSSRLFHPSGACAVNGAMKAVMPSRNMSATRNIGCLLLIARRCRLWLDVTGAGIEPATRALKVRCSTTELPGRGEPRRACECTTVNSRP